MSADKYSDAIEILIEQRNNVRDWIRLEAADTFSDQLHLVENSHERAYWHHGYQAALGDVIRQFTANDPSDCTAGKPN